MHSAPRRLPLLPRWLLLLCIGNWLAWVYVYRTGTRTCPPPVACPALPSPQPAPARKCSPAARSSVEAAPSAADTHCFTDLALLTTFSLEPPPRQDVPSQIGNLKQQSFSQLRQDLLVDELLGGMVNGFFVECGAYDGLVHSNSLYLENTRNWTGLLVEPNPRAYHELVVRDRHVHTARACLSVTGRFAVVDFMNNGEIGGVLDGSKRDAADGRSPYIYQSSVPCYPIGTMLRALNRTVVDYFSLDVEGAELSVLNSFPWDEVIVKVWTIEYANPTSPTDPSLFDNILLPRGYKLSAKQVVSSDRVYYHSSVNVPSHLRG